MDIEDTIAKQSPALTSTSAYDRHSNSLRSVVLPIILSDVIFNSITMREIKFRAWDKKEKYMSKTFSLEDASYNGFPRPFVDDNGECDTRAEYEVMQFTGLLDKNGKEIYEGDYMILGEDKDVVFEVFYHEGKGAFDCARVHYHKGRCGIFVPSVNSNRLQVIGNIYENPDLLA